jgi:hypothetical protein
MTPTLPSASDNSWFRCSEEALTRHEEMPGPDGEPVNPTLHVALHIMIANQLLADDPPEELGLR